MRPDIKKSMWTEEDDMTLIEAHKTYGNRWSVIARFLPGRSENAVKNHWNATKRSLKAKRRLKKKKKKKNAQAPPGQQWSILEEYIRDLYPAATDPAPPPPPFSPPSYSNLGYGEVVSPPAAAATPAGFDPTGMGMYLNAANSSSNLGPMNLNVPLLLDLNAYYGRPLQAMAEVKPQMMDQDQQVASYTNLMMSYPFVYNFLWQSSVHANASANNAGSYGEAAAADQPGSVDGSGVADDVDVVQMASREFLTPSVHEVTLDQARFM